jgi:ubiquinone/menaquinone biosynthesis C-methylase UbiE
MRGPSMSPFRALLMRSFGQPSGLLGRLGGYLMARMNASCGAWVCDLLEIEPDDHVLEVGFGPGVVIQRASELIDSGSIAGVDPSQEMLEQARVRNASAIQAGRVDLRRASVENMPFVENSFDKALAVNSMQIWPDATVGLRQIFRVLKPGGRIALGFTHHSGKAEHGMIELLSIAGFSAGRIIEGQHCFCVLAEKPRHSC